MAYRQTSWCVFLLIPRFFPQNALAVVCQNLINETKLYFTKHLLIYLMHFSGRASATDRSPFLYYIVCSKFAVSSPKRSSVRFQGHFWSLQLFKFILKCLLMYPMRVRFCSLFYVCLPSISYIFISQKYVLTLKHANCPNPVGRKKAVKIASRFKFAAMHLQMFNTFQSKHDWKPWH